LPNDILQYSPLEREIEAIDNDRDYAVGEAAELVFQIPMTFSRKQ
jgi:hypothetical protein